MTRYWHSNSGTTRATPFFSENQELDANWSESTIANSNGGSVSSGDIAKNGTYSLSWWSTAQANATLDWSVYCSGQINLSSVTNMLASGNTCDLYRLDSTGTNNRANYQGGVDFGTAGLKNIGTTNWSNVNSNGSRAATDTLAIRLFATQNGGHSVGSYTVQDNPTGGDNGTYLNSGNTKPPVYVYPGAAAVTGTSYNPTVAASSSVVIGAATGSVAANLAYIANPPQPVEVFAHADAAHARSVR